MTKLYVICNAAGEPQTLNTLPEPLRAWWMNEHAGPEMYNGYVPVFTAWLSAYETLLTWVKNAPFPTDLEDWQVRRVSLRIGAVSTVVAFPDPDGPDADKGPELVQPRPRHKGPPTGGKNVRTSKPRPRTL